ncbi:MAG TPA: hypothetical protein VJW76_04475 [Verrucomicrobiae bacterium]|nr:hypothetical protein [Verrucomicrobiae bacterium]
MSGNKVFAADFYYGLSILNLFEPPPRFESFQWIQTDRFKFSVRGESGRTVRIQRSENLRDWGDWQSVTFGNTALELNETNASVQANRFYRAVSP